MFVPLRNSQEPDLRVKGWSDNPREGNSFGPDVLESFLQWNNFEMMCRTGLVHEGFEWFGDTKLITIISVADYAGEFKNKGAVMLIDDSGTATFSVFESPGAAPTAPLAKDAAGDD
eukprot:s404_g15.t1